ncbi:MAG: hypothetical protein R3335_15230, partial [Anaerolineales bacterium]|nr:hypothetical protein [Anaerolineales bacterium]
MKVSIRGYGAFAILAGITLFLVVQGTAAGAPAAPALAGLTPEPESYLPLVARQPTLTPTPTPTATVTPTPTNT